MESLVAKDSPRSKSKEPTIKRALLTRSVTHTEGVVVEEKPKLRKTSSVGHSLKSKFGLSSRSTSLGPEEIATVTATTTATTRSAAIFNETEEMKQEAGRKKIFVASLKAYEMYKSYGGCLMNFLVYDEDDRVEFCYAHDCTSSPDMPFYVKILLPTQYCENYAGFKECAIFRNVKLCPSCFLKYRHAPQGEKEEPPIRPIKISRRSFKLFTPLQ